MTSIGGKKYLFGVPIMAQKKNKQGTIAYKVQWEDISLKEVYIDIQFLYPAQELAKKLRKQESTILMQGRVPPTARDIGSRPFSRDLRIALFLVEEGEEGDPYDSDLEYDDDADSLAYDETGDIGDLDLHRTREVNNRRPIIPEFREKITGQPETVDPTDPYKFRWRFGGKMNPPPNISTNRKTQLKEGMEEHFRHPLPSLLAFIPMHIWKSICIYSNAYAHLELERCTQEGKPRRICGATWAKDITLKELMVFFGILFKMTLRPTPGLGYEMAWQDTMWHPYTVHMPLRRFQQIRSVIHFNDNQYMKDSSDSLFKVRPLLNSLKITLGSYVEVGDDLAVDEASIASRSAYGRDLIFYNPKKPSGKFHFRFFLLCCSTTYICTRLRMETKNNSDCGDGYFDEPVPVVAKPVAGPKTTGLDDDDDSDLEASVVNAPEIIEEEEDHGKITKLVLDMAKPLFGSGRIINTDNYYTSPVVAAELMKHDVYIRGTVRANRKGFPQGVMFTKAEAKDRGRGTIKNMMDFKNQIVAYGWVDGNPVHFLTSADGTGTSSVTRRVGRESVRVRAPACIKKYNKGMQAVDRHDQLRALFSLCHRHGFKKYYVKLALGLIDIACVNAWLHWTLVNEEASKKRNARYKFFDDLADAFITTDWVEYLRGPGAESSEVAFKTLVTEGGTVSHHVVEDDPADELMDDHHAGDQCKMLAVKDLLREDRNKQKGLSCRVCRFEGRMGVVSSVVVDLKHCVQVCTQAHPPDKLVDREGKPMKDYSWRAPVGLSCWEKLHRFYIPNGLFRENIHPITADQVRELGPKVCQHPKQTSEPYRRKQVALGYPPTRIRPKRKHKNKNDSPADSVDITTQDDQEQQANAQTEKGSDEQDGSDNSVFMMPPQNMEAV